MWMETERQAMVKTLHASDPQAPTLCAEWNVSRLLAHLIVREEQPWKLVADGVRRNKPGQEHSLNALVDGAGTEAGYRRLVDRFAAGAPGISPMRWAGDPVNLLEFVVHHEDIRRGSGEVAAREMPPGQEYEVRRRLPLMARVGYLRAPVGVVLQLPGGEQARVRRGASAVTIAGPVTELALHAMGRRSAAQVDVSGAPESVELFRRFTGSGAG